MKTNITGFLGVLLSAAFLMTGCQKQDSSATVSGQVATVDSSAAEREFASAPPEVKGDFDSALSSIRAGEYKQALERLTNLAQSAKLTPEQKSAINDLIAKVQKAVTEGATKAVEGAEKALDDVKGSLPK